MTKGELLAKLIEAFGEEIDSSSQTKCLEKIVEMAENGELGGGGGALYLTMQENGATFILSGTYAEIEHAMIDGKVVYLIVDDSYTHQDGISALGRLIEIGSNTNGVETTYSVGFIVNTMDSETTIGLFSANSKDSPLTVTYE